MTQQLLRPAQAAKLLGISRTSLWRWARTRPDFPRPIHLGPATTAFALGELMAFINRRREAEDATF